MVTIKMKFRASSVKTREGALYYQVIHDRLARQIRSGYKLYPSEWDAERSKVILPSGIEEGRRYCLCIRGRPSVAPTANIIRLPYGKPCRAKKKRIRSTGLF